MNPVIFVGCLLVSLFAGALTAHIAIGVYCKISRAALAGMAALYAMIVAALSVLVSVVAR